jgi:hypothetical protein
MIDVLSSIPLFAYQHRIPQSVLVNVVERSRLLFDGLGRKRKENNTAHDDPRFPLRLLHPDFRMQ